jgi:hypothetical protein
MSKPILLSLFVSLALLGGLSSAQAPIYQLLYSAPNPSSQGAVPVTVFEVTPGLFYFLSAMQGQTFGPSILSLANTGSPKLIYSFKPQTSSWALVQGSNGRLYGSVFTPSSDDSFYYSVSVSGQGIQRYQTGMWGSLWMITPVPGTLYDGGGSLSEQGTTQAYGLARIDEGTVQSTVVYKFPSGTGKPGISKLVLGVDGNLYAVGSQSDFELAPPAFIYKLTPAGEYSRLLTFPSTMVSVYNVSLIAASDGNLYGTFSSSGSNGTGVIYQATLSGSWKAVASFPPKGANQGMYHPNSLMEASDNALYGSTVNNAIFRYDLATGALTLAYQMNPHNLQGGCAPCNFIQAMDGKLYGTASSGGPGGGAVFSLDFGLPKPPPSVAQLVPPSGSVGQQIMLWGSHLLGATSVTFNGVPAAAVQLNSTQAVMATVPQGATSGPVTITTSNGSVTCKQNFTVE